MARRLMEFLLWCESTNPPTDWRKVTYREDIFLRWQSGMLQGTASRTGKRLSPQTVNPRVSEACWFLAWAAERGFREKFEVSSKLVPTQFSTGSHSLSHVTSSRRSRIGSLAEPVRNLVLPSNEELARWMRQFRARHGDVMGLIAETMMRTGLRITENNQLLESDLPEKAFGPHRNQWKQEWLVANEVPVKIHIGNKGPKIHAGSLESTRPRTVYFPVDLADRIDYYRKEGRPTLVQRWISSAKEPETRAKRIAARNSYTTRLWLGQRGLPVSNSWIGQAWASVSACPEGWSPHQARHLFAVETMVDYTRKLMASKHASTVPDLGWLHGQMSGQIKIILTPLLGHLSEETTAVYLRAARQRLMLEFEHPTLSWLKACDEDLESLND